MKPQILVCLLIAVSCPGFSQEQTDPRRQEMLDHMSRLESATQDRQKLKSLLVICQRMRLFDLDSARTYCLQAVDLSKKVGVDSFRLSALGDLSVVYKRSNQLRELKEVCREGILLAKKENNVVAQANFLIDLGFAYERGSQANKAAEVWLEALAISKKANIPTQTGIALINLGNGYYYQSAFEKALNYYQQAYEHYQSPEDQFWKHTAAINMAESYRILGQTNKGADLTRDAILYFDSVENAQMLYHALHNQAEYYLEYQWSDSLAGTLQRLDSLASNPPNPEKETRIAILWAKKSLLDNEIKSLNSHSARALQLAKSLEDKNLLSEALRTRIDALEANQNWKEASSIWKQYQFLMDSISSAQAKVAYDELNLKYETEQKDLQIAEQSLSLQTQKNNQKLLIYLLVFFALLSIAIIILLRQRQTSAKIALQNSEKQMLIENMSAMIRGEEQERTRIARELHDGVGGLLSSAKMKLSAVKPEHPGQHYEEALTLLDITSTEIRRTAQNLMPEVLNRYGLEAALEEFMNQLRTNGSVELHFQAYDIPGDLPKEMQLHVYRIVQELVNNSMKHASASEILVQINGGRDYLQLSVEDNGTGMKEAHSRKTGLGLQTVASRVQWLRAKWDLKSVPDTGVFHQIDIPLKNMPS